MSARSSEGRDPRRVRGKWQAGSRSRTGSYRLGIAVLAVLALGIAGISIVRAGERPASGLILFTQIPVAETVDSRLTEPSPDGSAWRFPANGRIVAFDPENPAAGLRVLTEEFHSARAPTVSPDGRTLLFSGQRREGDPWHIWELSLPAGPVRQVTDGPGGLTDPVYVADRRIVYSSGDSALYATDPERSTATRITYHRGAAASPSVLRDGRVLFTSASSRGPGAGDPLPAQLFTVRFDGTGAELFYRGPEGFRPVGRAWETADGTIVFVETEGAANGGSLAAVSKLRPLHTRELLSEGLEGSFHSAFPIDAERYAVSYRPAGSERYGLYQFDPVERQLEPMLDTDPVYHAVEPVVAVERPAPKTFESVVDTSKVSGELFCLNADLSTLPPVTEDAAAPRSVAVRVSSLDGIVGEVPLEADGSFYIELLADTPVRIETLDEDGSTVRGPSAWIWVRPGERRGCIGCHEDRELAPENRVPMAVRARPIVLDTNQGQVR
jgi:hypothetical protein